MTFPVGVAMTCQAALAVRLEGVYGHRLRYR